MESQQHHGLRGLRQLTCTRIAKLSEQQGPFNPSKAGKWLALRTAKINERYHDSTTVILNVETKEQFELKVPEGFLVPTIHMYRGLEDVRLLLTSDGQLWFTASSTHASKKMQSECVVGRIDTTKKEISHIARIDGVWIPPVKNISIFEWSNSLWLWDATSHSIYRLNKDTITVEDTHKLSIGKSMDWGKWMRTSTSWVPISKQEPWMVGCVVHECLFAQRQGAHDRRLSYLHYWVEADMRSGCITFLSGPFIVHHWGTEFVSSIEINIENGDAVLFFGVEDNQALIANTTISNLRA